MSFFDKLLNKNPTADWQADKNLVLMLDVEQESLCGITIGDAVNRLTKLGPAEDAATARNGWYRYPSYGFSITCERERVVEVELSFGEDSCFGGHVAIRGAELPLEGDITEEIIVAAAGAPDERIVQDGDESSVTLRYKRTKADWQFELEDGKLESIWGGKRD